MSIRIGYGIDYHRFGPDRPFIIGGIEIPHHFGCIGHSDADVLLHAICDALLGSLALGDIGLHFPDNDNQYKNIDSKILLSKCVNLIQNKGYKVINIDSTVCLQNPKLKPHIPKMQAVIAEILGVQPDDVGIKATTTENLGFVGREEGVQAQAVVLIEKL